MKVKNKGLILAATAAAILASGSVSTAFAADKDASAGSVKCDGANACKGKSDCKTAKHDCKGKNECKGKGRTLEKTAEDCKKAGGTVAEK